MRTNHRWALIALLGTVALIVGVAAPAQTKKPAPAKEDVDIPAHLAKKCKMDPEDVNKLLAALGPAVREAVAVGKTVTLPGLGTFRVVRIPEHRDLVDGRPTDLPAFNYVEFLPDGGIVDAANAPGATPAVTVPQFQYNPLPNQTKGQRVPSSRAPSTRLP